jgi:hypothetical protein
MELVSCTALYAKRISVMPSIRCLLGFRTEVTLKCRYFLFNWLLQSLFADLGLS